MRTSLWLARTRYRIWVRLLLSALPLLLLAAVTAPAAEDGIIAPGAKVELLADGFKFTEGPAADADGNVFFTDQPNDRILNDVCRAEGTGSGSAKKPGSD